MMNILVIATVQLAFVMRMRIRQGGSDEKKRNTTRVLHFEYRLKKDKK